MAIHKDSTAISKLWKIPLQFANFEKRNSRLRKMPLEMAWNGIFQSLEIAVAFLGYTRFGVAFIKLTQNKNNWASCWVPGVSRSVMPTMQLYLSRVEARPRGITALWFGRKKGHLHTIPCNEQEWDKELAYNRHFTQYINIIIHHPKYNHKDRLRSKSRWK